MLRCAVLDDYQNVALSLADWKSLAAQVETRAYNAPLGGIEAVSAAIADCEIVVIMRERTPFSRALLERLPQLRLLVTTGLRNHAIDLAAARERGVAVCGTDILKYPTAELTWGLLLALVRHIPAEARRVGEGGWQHTLGTGLSGKTLGVIGLGVQGGRVAGYGKAFGMEVIAWSPNLTEARCAELGVRKVDKDTLLSSADVITVHLVLGDRSRGLIGPREFGLMKPGAFLVNTSRGPIVQEAALIDALRRKAIAGAALDVFDVEPLPGDHPLRALSNAVLTPHLGYVTVETYRIFYEQAVEDIRAWLAGKPLRSLTAEMQK